MSFIECLHEHGLIDKELYMYVHVGEQKSERDIYQRIIDLGYLSDSDLAKLRADYESLEFSDLKECEAISNMDYQILRQFHVYPHFDRNKNLCVATPFPISLEASDFIERCLRNANLGDMEYEIVISPISVIHKKISEVLENESDIISKIIYDAIDKNASDIHITPFYMKNNISFRVDGDIHEYSSLNEDDFKKLCISIKVKSKLDISETRRPQFGHFQKNGVDFRVSSHPVVYGEKIVIRILNKNKSLITIDKLGYTEEQISYLKHISNLSKGLIIFCGPTGSGKTTSIYALLETMDKKSRNIMTLEDPVEYRIEDVSQTEIKKGIFDFADGVRSILRQDPDVLLIGEIRDEETARMAIRASLTGHLVFSTIHANDSFGAISRLRELNVPNSLISDNLVSIISQRIIKNHDASGRSIVCEILKIDEKLSNMICESYNKSDLKKYALENLDFKTIEEDCKSKIEKQLISDIDAKKYFVL